MVCRRCFLLVGCVWGRSRNLPAGELTQDVLLGDQDQGLLLCGHRIVQAVHRGEQVQGWEQAQGSLHNPCRLCKRQEKQVLSTWCPIAFVPALAAFYRGRGLSRAPAGPSPLLG